MRHTLLLYAVLLVNTTQASDETRHWSFRATQPVSPPKVRQTDVVRTPVDAFLQAALERRQLHLGPQANTDMLRRRLGFDLTGLVTSQNELLGTLDSHPDGIAKAVDRLLAAPSYGERWGKFWLDVAGYADSNGYFNADTDRPLAYKYRDYVIRAFNSDKPFDQFVKEQLAGDEIAGYSPDGHVTDRTIELLTATHFLRNAQDGSSESDGNPDEVTIDRATVTEGTLQITMNSLLGITIQCCRCHEHKFEPIEHAEYYQLQSVFYPAFPFFHRDAWIGPVQRVSHVASEETFAAWEATEQKHDQQIASLRGEFHDWVKANRPPGVICFEDGFDGPDARVSAGWSNAAPGDEPAGDQPVRLDSAMAPAARIENGALVVHESGTAGNRWLSTKHAFDWTPARKGEWIQVTFDLLRDRLGAGSEGAFRIGYYISLHDYDDSTDHTSGNILVDGNPTGGAAIHTDYPGDDQKHAGSIGTSGYEPGHSYGVRITNAGGDQFRIEHIVDWIVEEKAVTLTAADLPDGAFGFEFCCGRSFVVDNVVIEGVSPNTAADKSPEIESFARKVQERQGALQTKIEAIDRLRTEKPGKLAWITDLVPSPEVRLLERGLYSQPGEVVQPSGLATLTDPDSGFRLPELQPGMKSSGRRLAFANWLTQHDSRASALLARVFINRLWQQHFGRGIVSTVDNLGQSGSSPSHPRLLEYLANEFVRSGWSIKSFHRLIVNSHAWQQSSQRRDTAFEADPENRFLWRFPLRRLNAEGVRDAMLAASGELDDRLFGPYVPVSSQSDGNVVVDENHAGARRRGIYLQQRRTQMNSLLLLFDAPAMVSTCGQRTTSTVPLQSLALLNSGFARHRSSAFAARLLQETPGDENRRLNVAFQLTFGREPTTSERAAASSMLHAQRAAYAPNSDAELHATSDLCQMLFASNAFLYVE